MNDSNFQPPSQPPSSATPQGASPLAIMSLVLGVASWVILPLIGAVVAMVLGKMELGNIAAGKSSTEGKSFAQIGFWLGAIQTALWALSCVASVVMVGIYLVFGIAFFGAAALAQ